MSWNIYTVCMLSYLWDMKKKKISTTAYFSVNYIYSHSILLYMWNLYLKNKNTSQRPLKIFSTKMVWWINVSVGCDFDQKRKWCGLRSEQRTSSKCKFSAIREHKREVGMGELPGISSLDLWHQNAHASRVYELIGPSEYAMSHKLPTLSPAILPISAATP